MKSYVHSLYLAELFVGR